MSYFLLENKSKMQHAVSEDSKLNHKSIVDPFSQQLIPKTSTAKIYWNFLCSL